MKNMRKALSLIMVFAMLCGLMVTTAFASDYNPTPINNLTELQNMDLDGDYYLNTNITINASNWTPIGNASTPFTGTFDGKGNNYTITWTGSAAGSSYYGIFGNSSGVVANVNAAGSLTLTGTISYVSPIVGYSSGSVYNCVSDVDFTGNNADNVGGVVGAIENLATTSSPIYIQYCGNTGDITALKRVGGVVGAVYCNVQGNCVVDQCYSKNCAIYTRNSSKVWSGGLAGYVKGGITNCYADNISLQASGGHYLSGLIGILNGSNPAAYAANCYANVTSYTNCAANYDRPFVGSADSSSAVTLDHCYWTETNASYTQPHDSTWGTWTNEGVIGSDVSWSNLSLGNKFTSGSNSSHPTLTCEATPFNFDVESGTPGGATSATVYLDGTSSTNGDGTAASPYNNLDSAVNAAAGGTVLISGTVTFTGTAQRYDAVTFQRATGFNGPLFTINAPSATVTLSSMTLDGAGSGTLINLTAGTLRLRGNIALTNCATAVEVNGGALELNKASVAGSTYSVRVNGGTFTLEDFGGTSITGAVYLASGKYITAAAAIPCELAVESVDTDIDTVIAAGTDDYAVTSADAGKIDLNGGVNGVTVNGNNQIVIEY